MSKKVLVAYATKMGATATIAAAIGSELRAAGHQVDVHEIGAVLAVSEYDAVIVGSAIYKGRWRTEAVRFLRDHETPGTGPRSAPGPTRSPPPWTRREPGRDQSIATGK